MRKKSAKSALGRNPMTAKSYLSTTFAIAIAFWPLGVAAKYEIAVIDGDTVIANGMKIRLLEIDAPEIFHPTCNAERNLGNRAKIKLQGLLHQRQNIQFIFAKAKDRYNRFLAHMIIDGKDVGAILLKEGFALPWYPGSAAWKQRKKTWCQPG